MYDKPIKCIHLGLQESSLINSEIYSYGFDATVCPSCETAQACRVSVLLLGDAFVFQCCKLGGIDLTLIVQAPANLDWLFCPFLSS